MAQLQVFLLIPWCYNPSGNRVYQSIAGLTSICPWIEVEDHPANLGVKSGYKYHAKCYISKLTSEQILQLNYKDHYHVLCYKLMLIIYRTSLLKTFSVLYICYKWFQDYQFTLHSLYRINDEDK